MAQQINLQRITRMIQQTLAEIFVQENKNLFPNNCVTVTKVQVGVDLSLAKVYLSFITTQTKAVLLEEVKQHKGYIRRMLGNTIGKKLRKIPDLRFYIDETIDYVTKIDRLIDDLPIPPPDTKGV